MNPSSHDAIEDSGRRQFLSMAGKGVGLAALAVPAVASLLDELHAAVRSVSLLLHQGIGPKRKEARLRYLSRYWMNKLKDVPRIRYNTSLDSEQSCGIANVEVTGMDPRAIAAYLMDKHKIFTVAIVHPEFNGLRITSNLHP